MPRALALAEFGGAALLLLLLSGCGSTPGISPFQEAGPLWPAAPEPARIQFVGEFSNPGDLGIQPSLWGRLMRFAAGASRDSMVRPMAVASALDGKLIYVADPGAQCVHRYDLARGRYTRLVRAGRQPLLSPVGLAVTPSGKIFVTDSQLGKVFVAEAGAPELEAMPLSTDSPSAIRQPTGIAWAEETQRLYVVDTIAHVVREYDANGQYLAEFGGRGDAPGAMNFPTYLWQDAAEGLLVTDSLNFRIQLFDSTGRPSSQFGKPGDGGGSLARPKGVALDSFGHVYVMDSLFQAMHIFDLSGTLLLALGEQGQAAGQFWLPAGLFIDSADRIFVADAYNHRIQVFRYIGAKP